MSNARTIPDKMKEAQYTGKEVLVVAEDDTEVTFTPDGLKTFILTDAETVMEVPAIETAGGTTIPAGTLLETLQAIADLADPAP